MSQRDRKRAGAVRGALQPPAPEPLHQGGLPGQVRQRAGEHHHELPGVQPPRQPPGELRRHQERRRGDARGADRQETRQRRLQAGGRAASRRLGRGAVQGRQGAGLRGAGAHRLQHGQEQLGEDAGRHDREVRQGRRVASGLPRRVRRDVHGRGDGPEGRAGHARRHSGRRGRERRARGRPAARARPVQAVHGGDWARQRRGHGRHLRRRGLLVGQHARYDAHAGAPRGLVDGGGDRGPQGAARARRPRAGARARL